MGQTSLWRQDAKLLLPFLRSSHSVAALRLITVGTQRKVFLLSIVYQILTPLSDNKTMIIPTTLPKPKASGIDPYHARRRRRNPSLKPKLTAKAKDDKDSDIWDMDMQSPQKKQVSSLATADTTSHDDLPYQTERRRRPPQALGLDTRLLVVTAANDDNDVEHEKKKTHDLYQTLLHDMAVTGVLPCLIVSTATEEQNETQGSSSSKNSKKIVLEREVLHTLPQLQEMQIQPIIFSHHQDLKNKEQPLVEFPKQLLAKSTWKIMRGLGKNEKEGIRYWRRKSPQRN